MRLSSKAFAPKMNVSVWQIFKILWGISTILVAAVICLLLIVGGVEVNPGLPRKDLISSSEDDLEVQKSIDFGGISQGNYVFSSPATPLHTMQKRRVVVGAKKRPNKFGAQMKREKVAIAPEYSPVPTTCRQTSVTESLDILELSTKVPRVSEETQNKIITFLDSQ